MNVMPLETSASQCVEFLSETLPTWRPSEHVTWDNTSSIGYRVLKFHITLDLYEDSFLGKWIMIWRVREIFLCDD